MPIQQLMLGSTPPSKNYIDEVYSNYLHTGNGSSQSITNGIDLAGQGGMVWIKNRDQNDNNWLFANSLGIGNPMRSNSDGEKFGLGNNGISSFNSNGFTVGSSGSVNGDGEDLVSWTFRNSKAFQCLTYAGNATNRTISHSLGSIPGMVIVKKTDGSDPWYVWHRDLENATKTLSLNTTGGEGGNAAIFNSTRPTATEFSLGTSGHSNENNKNYIAYLFAGGESTAATARSVSFDGNDDLTIQDSTDFDLGTTFTWEFWIKMDNLQDWYVPFRRTGSSSVHIQINAAGQLQYSASPNISSANGAIQKGQWTHCALVVDSGVGRWYVNGTPSGSASSGSTGSGYDGTLCIGGWGNNSSYYIDGSISNLRLVAGTAVYTAPFRPPYEPLTNISGTVLLCCNNSSVTGATVTPGTITSSWGTPTASIHSPFDDPAGYVFGEEENQNVFKMGSYVGNGSAIGPDVYVGWEPQDIIIKRIDDSENWVHYDVMRGIVTDGNDQELIPQSSALEYTYNRLEVTSTGFRPMVDNQYTNEDGGTFVYFCVRRPDGNVRKPVTVGTNVFSINSGSASGAPLFDSTNVVDFQMVRKISATWNWETGARLFGPKQVYANTTGAGTEIDPSGWKYDYQNGWHTNASGISNYMCWMWSRHAGFDVVIYKGGGASSAPRSIPHSLGKAPEMIWTKNRSSTVDWVVWHKGLNGGGSGAAPYNLRLNDTDIQNSNSDIYGGANNALPTSTHWTMGGNNQINENGSDFISFLFASVDGVSKVGSYAGSDSDQTITLGFEPRFLIVKAYTHAHSWLQLDTTRGWATSSGNNSQYLFLDLDWAQNGVDVGYKTSTGFVAKGGSGNITDAGVSYIYYAHA